MRSHLPLARSATASSCAASVATSISTRSRLSCVGVSAGRRAVARVSAIRCLGLRIGLQHTLKGQDMCLPYVPTCMQG